MKKVRIDGKGPRSKTQKFVFVRETILRLTNVDLQQVFSGYSGNPTCSTSSGDTNCDTWTQ